MGKRFYKGILLVLSSSNDDLYKNFKKIFKEYYAVNENILVLFVYGQLDESNREDCDLVYDVPENYYPGMVQKTFLALEHIEETYDYDFIIRTNLSTFWLIDRLEKRLDKTQKENCFHGSLIRDDQAQDNVWYLAGVNMVLSRDVVRKIIETKEESFSLDRCPEDKALCLPLMNRGYKPTHIVPPPLVMVNDINEDNTEVEVSNKIQYADERNRDHFRIKTRFSRKNDINIANILLKHYYAKTIL